MKFLHVADLHIGKVINGFSMLEDQKHVLREVLDLAQTHDADALLIAGDVYDKSAPSAEAVSMLDWLFGQCIEQKLPCVLIPGNHDSAERLAYAAGSLAQQNIFIAPLFDGRISPVPFEDEHGVVDVWPIPFLKPAQVRPYFPDAEIGTSYTAALQAVIDACPLNSSHCNVAVCHQFVVAGSSTPEQCDSELSIGGLDAVDARVFEQFDYVALGHLHQAQRIGKDVIRYSGSPLKYSASEANHYKGAVLVTIKGKRENGDANLSYETLELNPLRDTRRIKGPLSELIDPEVAASQNKLDYLHVTLTDETPVIDALSRLRAVYPNVMSLEYQAPEEVEGLKPLAPSEQRKDPFELFERFYSQQTGSELSPKQSELARRVLAACRDERGFESESDEKGNA